MLGDAGVVVRDVIDRGPRDEHALRRVPLQHLL